MWNDELEVEISIGTDIPDREPIDEIHTQIDLPPHPDVHEDPSPSSSLEVDNMQGSIFACFPHIHIKFLAKSDHLTFAAFHI